MASDRKGKGSGYRWQAFTHWLNLLFLTAGGVAAATYDPSILLAIAPLEAGILWVLPDLPSFRGSIDRRRGTADILKERAYYVEQLWGLYPETKTMGQRIASWFTDSPPEDVDHRVIKREERTFKEYYELRQIIKKLRELEQVRGVKIPAQDTRFEQVVNGYLRFLIAARALAKALQGIDEGQLQAELDDIDKRMENAHPELRAALLERRRLKVASLERLPKLQATFELFRTRAEAIVYQMRNIHGQVLADPGMDVNSFLDDLVERQEILVDPLGELEADQVVHELLHRDDKISAELSRNRAAAAAAARTKQH